jgi:hypothetical protein
MKWQGKTEERKRLSLAVKLDASRSTEAGECQIDVCKALGLAGSTVQCLLKMRQN